MTFQSLKREGSEEAKRPAEQSEEQYYDDDAFDVTEFGQGGKYLRNKRKKMNKQVQSMLGQSDIVYPQIFTSLRIYINGYTGAKGLPQFIEMITLHGGLYVPYLDRKGLVTHIVASTLTPSKIKEFKDYKVARPSWLDQSVEQGRLLDWRLFSTVAEVETTHGFDDDAGRRGTRPAQQSLFGLVQPSKAPVVKSEALAPNVKPLRQVRTASTPETRAERDNNPQVSLPHSTSSPTKSHKTIDRKDRPGSIPSPPSSGSSQSVKAASIPCITLSDDDDPGEDPEKLHRIGTKPPAVEIKAEPGEPDFDREELQYYDIDADVFAALPLEERHMALSSAKLRRLAPRQTQRQSRLQGYSSKPSLETKASPKTLKSTSKISTSPTKQNVPEVSAECTREEATLLGLDYDSIQALPPRLRREQVRERREWSKKQDALRVTSTRRDDPATRQAAVNSKLRRVPVREPVKFRAQVDQDSIRDIVEAWLRDALLRGLDESDVERIVKFLEKRSTRNKGCDLNEVNDVLGWWAGFLTSEIGSRSEAKGTGEALWEALERVQSKLSKYVQNEYGRPLCSV